AINIAFNNLASIVTLPTGAVAPFFTLDKTSGLLAYNAQNTFYDYTLALPIQLYMNQNLWTYFDGIPIIEVGSVTGQPVANGRDALFIPFNNHDNIITYGSA